MMTLTPATVQQQNEPNESKKSNKNDDTKRQRNLLEIALKIAEVGGYDEDLRIKTSKGDPVKESNVIGLIQHSLTPMKSTRGLNEFVEMLYKSGIDPDLIKNVQVKNMLDSRMEKGKWKQPLLDNVEEPYLLAVPREIPKETLKIKPKRVRKKVEPIKHLMSLRQKARVNRKKQQPKSAPPKKRKILGEISQNNKRHKNTLWDDQDSDLD